jgi:hypothetical protein
VQERRGETTSQIVGQCTFKTSKAMKGLMTILADVKKEEALLLDLL